MLKKTKLSRNYFTLEFNFIFFKLKPLKLNMMNHKST